MTSEKIFTIMLCLTIIFLIINLVKIENFNQQEPLTEREIERVKDFLNSKLEKQQKKIKNPSAYKNAIQTYINKLKEDIDIDSLNKLLKIQSDCLKLKDIITPQQSIDSQCPSV